MEGGLVVGLGECMYCGSRELPLTKEHILPRGLNGELVFPDSCCKECQKKIGLVETRILKSGWLSDPRLVMGLRSYRPKAQARHVKMSFVSYEGREFDKNVPKEEAVASISLPELIAPRYLEGDMPLIAQDGIEIVAFNDALVYRGVIEDVQKGRSERLSAAINGLCKKNRAKSFKFSTRIIPRDMVRFLCKMAYGFHVYERGAFPRQDSPALSVLMGGRSDLSNWVGSQHGNAAMGNSELHSISIEDIRAKSGHDCTVVKIRMFNSLGPGFSYVVVTQAVGWKELVLDATRQASPDGVVHAVSYL